MEKERNFNVYSCIMRLVNSPPCVRCYLVGEELEQVESSSFGGVMLEIRAQVGPVCA